MSCRKRRSVHHQRAAERLSSTGLALPLDGELPFGQIAAVHLVVAYCTSPKVYTGSRPRRRSGRLAFIPAAARALASFTTRPFGTSSRSRWS